GPRFHVGPETTVLGPDQRPVAPGEVGVLARSVRIPVGYYGDPEKTAATFCEVDGKRWARSGDFATIEDDGSITLLGRGSQVINSGGEKVHPEEVDRVLSSHPAVVDSAVVGVSHETWGEQVTALVQLRTDSDVTAEELREHCRGAIAGYKVP